MNIELTALLFFSVMTLFMILMQAIIAMNDYGLPYVLGNRDTPPGSESLLVNRLERAIRNNIESAIIFAPLILIAAITHISNMAIQWGAIVFVGSRLAYAFLYAFGISGVRTLIWNIGILALGMIAIGIFLNP
ncbi:MAG TPA: hypothetical protein DEA26_04820 [Oceanospirillales bacterium]|nr:hypothetical protein [Oceanospirillaceae bacterium]HBS41980.1 hypothetical protein [Oceanospirillales bacterium]|tara:strand:+ start:1389 stop:1787 length:399 start_codon:yes stop_codon:yes gene_type:complete